MQAEPFPKKLLICAKDWSRKLLPSKGKTYENKQSRNFQMRMGGSCERSV